MKALTLTQPWATLIALGEKRVETRSWWTNYRGPLAIHASKYYSPRERSLGRDMQFSERDSLFYHALHPNGLWAQPEEFCGCIVCTTYLADCRRTEDALNAGLITPREQAFGDFSPGRYAWILGPPDRVFAPGAFRVNGHLGLWEWNENQK